MLSIFSFVKISARGLELGELGGHTYPVCSLVWSVAIMVFPAPYWRGRYGAQHQESGVMARKLRVWVDHNVCVGNAMCETFAPQVFQLNANRQSEAVNPAGDPEEKILEAAENCPVSAIFVEDADTGERLFP
jgi:ferredoxin